MCNHCLQLSLSEPSGSSAHKKVELKQNPVSQETTKAGKKAKKPVREEEGVHADMILHFSCHVTRPV